MEIFDKIKEEVKKDFVNARGSHDWSHTERVYKLCMHIGEKEEADLEVLKYAAILHDMGRAEEDEMEGKICHAEKGAELARELLNRYNFSNDEIDKITHCIVTHRYRNESRPESKEAKILFDADKLDSIGATGIGRAFLFAGEIGAKLHNKGVDIEKTEQYS